MQHDRFSLGKSLPATRRPQQDIVSASGEVDRPENGDSAKRRLKPVQRTISIVTLLCDRFRGVRGYSAPWRLMLRTALIPSDAKLYCIVYIIQLWQADKGLWMAREATIASALPAPSGGGGALAA